MNTLRIIIADDHGTVREGLRRIVEAQPDMEVVAEVGDGRAAVARTRELAPDIAVLDVSMPEVNGLRATEQIKQCCPQTKVLAITRHTDSGYLQQMLAAGANGYVLKQSAADDLIHAIRAVAKGGQYLDPAIAGKVTSSFAGRASALRGEASGQLSERESEVLRLIAWGHSNKEIASKFDLSVKTIEAHKANAMKKLGINSRIDIVRYALLQNWLQEG